MFPFSLRPGTAAERLPDRVASPTANRRAAELRALGDRKARAYEATRVGGQADVIAIGPAESAKREGLTEDFLSVSLEDPTIPRGTRFGARLKLDGDRLVAVAIA